VFTNLTPRQRDGASLVMIAVLLLILSATMARVTPGTDHRAQGILLVVRGGIAPVMFIIGVWRFLTGRVGSSGT